MDELIADDPPHTGKMVRELVAAVNLRDLNELAEFLRLRAAEDLASGDGLRRARGRAVAMLVGQVGNVPEHFTMELVWLATHYADHPDYRQEWKPLG